MVSRAAIVIGVNTTGQMVPLKSAAASALEVSNWLKKEEFDVTCITDAAGPVDSHKVREAFKAYVTNPPRYSLLLVYFSGHGLWQARSDYWLLSGAPEETSEAVNLDGAMDLARNCGIPNVVFISDACRSQPNSRSGGFLQGIDALPSFDDITSFSKVDYIKATGAAREAYEVTIEDQRHSVLTRALQSAYEKPTYGMVRKIVEGGKTLNVVPNRQLENYLQPKIDSILASINPSLAQRIEISIPSSEDVYIARAQTLPTPPPPAPMASAREEPTHRGSTIRPRTGEIVISGGSPRVSINPGRDAAAAITRALSSPADGRRAARSVTAIVGDPITESLLNQRLPDKSVDHFESQTGFVVRGAAIASVVTAPSGKEAALLQSGDGKDTPGLIRMDGQQSLSVMLIFTDGRCVILPSLPGYLAHARMTVDGLIGVSYVPSSNHRRWDFYRASRDRVDGLRALVNLAVENNTFKLKSAREADELAQQIRIFKSIDPALGLYAAHAYAQSGNETALIDVINHMRLDLEVDLFDLRVLAPRHFRFDVTKRVPFCPVLTQSWNLLRARGIEVPSVLARSSGYLCDSLWTTFEAAATPAILAAIHSGELR